MSIVQRFASLATLFYLLSLILFIKGRLSLITHSSKLKTILYISASLFSAILAMKTKEISFTLPFIILLYEFMFLGRFRIAFFIPFLIPLLIIPLNIIRSGIPLGDMIGELGKLTYTTEKIPRGIYLLTQFRVIVTYIRLLFLPIDQNLDYDYPLSRSFFESGVFFCFIFLLSIFCLAIYLYIRSRRGNNGYALLASFGILWFFITLSVESSIITIQDVIFEHRLYLPSVGVVIAFSATIFYALHKARSKVNPLLATCLVLFITAVPLGIATYNRNWVWRSEITLWEDVVRKSPAKARGHKHLGYAYYKQNQVNEAIEKYRMALSIRADYPGAHLNLGLAYHWQGRLEEAITEYEKALKIRPDYPEVHLSLGVAYYRLGRMDKAINEYRETLRLKPGYPEAYYRLAATYYRLGRMDEAIAQYKKALERRPDYHEAHYNLAIVYFKQGRIDEAISEYRKALSLRPDLPPIEGLEEILRRIPQ